MTNKIILTVAGSLLLGLTGCTDVAYQQPTYKKKHNYESQATSTVNYSQMKAYCKGEAAGQYGTRPQYINVGNVHPRNNKYIAKGTADLGRNGQKPFKCVFDGNGNFLRFQSLVNEGSL